jgi:integrase
MSSPALRLVPPSGTGRHPDPDTAWLGWLVAHVDPFWRPGEWDQELWLFTGNLDSDRTAAWPCRTPSCPAATPRHDGRCSTCRRAQTASGVGDDEFDRHPRRAPFYPLVRATCTVPGCECEIDRKGLCLRHFRAWEPGRAGGESLQSFLARARPLERHERCLVGGCPRERATRRGLCRFHDNRLRRAHDVASFSKEEMDAWVAAQGPRLGPHQFSLAGLAELVRFELLYGLQRRDEAPPPLAPLQVRILVQRLGEATSIRVIDFEAVCAGGGVQYNGAIRGLLADVRRHLERAWTQNTGVDPYVGDVWQVALLDLQSNGSRRWPATQGVIDFRTIEVSWLREVLKQWAAATRPYLQRLREALRACGVASLTLVAAGRSDPASLCAGDFAHIVDAISGHRRADGTLHSAAHRNLLVHSFCEVADFGRTNGLMDQVPDPFRLARRKRVVEEPNEEELGKALPDSLIRQLDANLHLLGPAGRAGSFAPPDLQAMHQAIYRLLRDTGRRPGEVVSLKVDCVEVIDGAHNLIYDNHKAGRLRRRLPITRETAEAVAAWERRRSELPDPPATRQWLFPSPLLRAHQALGHLGSACVGLAFRTWVGRIATLDSEVLGPDGHPVAFNRSLIAPYALRHSYAQRHADAGVPVDVLKELMDHRSVGTTMGYYRISLHRKAQAIARVGSLAVDANGNPSPFSSPLAYQRASVSVPFGNCTEPSNVKAGGGACPIRFQCAGCSFYRPDPSYLPALESHVANLRADRETARAMEAAGYVIANLTAEIDAFSRVADQMRRRMDELGSDERVEVEEASRLLRRARAARQLPLIATTGGTP